MVQNKRTLFRQITSFLLVAVIFFSFNTPVAQADQFDDQIKELNRQISEQQSQVAGLRAKKNNLENQIALLNAQISSTAAQLNLSQLKYDQVVEELSKAEEKLAKEKAIFAESVRTIYLEGQVTPIEMLASSNNFSDFVDRQQYLQAMKDKVQQSVEEIGKLKSQLETQREEQAKLVAQQTDLRNSLNSQRGSVSNLLAETRGEEAQYSQMVAANQAKVAQVRAAQAEMWRRIQEGSSGNSGTVGQFQYRNWTGNLGACGGGYGYDLVWGGNYCHYGLDAVVDRWDLYNRECVSYAAWAITYNKGGVVPRFSGRGHAYQWPSTLSGSYRIDDNPNGAAVVMVIPKGMIGDGGSYDYGHVAVVEQVLGDGWIRVSQYNWGVTGQYSVMDVKLVPGLQFIHFR